MDSNAVLPTLLGRALASPLSTFCTLCVLILVTTRINTGYLKRKQQNQISTSEKVPPIIPYWIPYLGHGPAAAWSFVGLLNRGRDTTRDGIFGIHMVGSNHYMVVMPSLVKQFFLKRASVLSGDDFIFWVYDKYFGDGGAAERTPRDDYHTVHKGLNSLMKEPFLSTATESTMRMVEDRVPDLVSLSGDTGPQKRWEKDAKPTAKVSVVEIDLFQLVMDFVGDIATTVLMGSAFTTNNPDVVKDLWAFDSGFGALLTGVPFVTPGLSKARAARTRVNDAVREWGQAMLNKLDGNDLDHKWGDLSDVSETMVVRMKALKSIDAEEAFIAASITAIFWGTNVNSNKIIFWMLLHIISTPKLAATIRKEIAPYSTVSPDGQLKLDADSLVKSCPMYKATFLETMRLYVAGISYKKVLEDLTLTESEEDATNFGKPRGQTYHISKGDFLVIPHEAMQTDPRLWKNPAVFDPYRFIVPDEMHLGELRADSLHLNSFGGGPSVCKGRHFAEREVLIFVAGLLSTWDFNPPGGKWEMPAKKFNGTGTASPKGAVRMRLARRKE